MTVVRWWLQTRVLRCLLAAFAVILALAFAPFAAQAAPAFLVQFGEGGFGHGGAGQSNIPRGVAVDSTSGHVYVSDQGNLRVDEFTAWGVFIRAWGWGVRDGSPALEACTAESGCRKGLMGSGRGQFGQFSPQGVALDSAGNLYLVDRGNHRIQKFSPSGEFLLMFGGGVNETSGGNVCPRPGFPGDVCKAGTTGTANGQFEAWPLSSNIAIDVGGTESASDDRIYVGDKDRIQRFDNEGEYVSSIPLAGKGYVATLALDSAGNSYAGFSSEPFGFPPRPDPNISKLSATGVVQCTIAVPEPTAAATGPGGAVYVIDAVSTPKVRQFDSSCKDTGTSFGGAQITESTGLGTNPLGDVYVANSDSDHSYVRAYGPEPRAYEEPPAVAPEIVSERAATVGSTSATVAAKIDPKFWRTHYYVQYGTAPCSGGGCSAKKPDPPGTEMGGALSEAGNASVSLEGLEAGRRYYFRFVASSEGDGGSPTVGEERSFTTYLPPTVNEACPNRAMRSGPGVNLPDCRGYEMVSPVQKNGSDVDAFGYEGFDASLQYPGLDQSTPDGSKLTYTATGAFAEPEGSPFVSQYIASRGAGGQWSTDPISPPGRGGIADNVANIDSEYKAFSPDLCQAWLVPESGDPLSAEATPGYHTLYRRENCATPASYEWLHSAAPEPEPCLAETTCSPYLFPELQGHSANGSRAVFRVNDALTPEAPRGIKGEATGFTAWQLYLHSTGEELRLVSVLPSGQPNRGSSSAGSENTGGPAGSTQGRLDSVATAASADASRVYWSTPVAPGAGTLYLRVNADKAPQNVANGTGKLTSGLAEVSEAKAAEGSFEAGQSIFGDGVKPNTTILAVSGETLTLSKTASKTKVSSLSAKSADSECDERLPCTLPVTGLLAGTNYGHFWAASPDGSRAIFSVPLGETVEGGLFEYTYHPETEEGSVSKIAGESDGVLGSSQNLDRLYFASEEAIAGSGTNGEGDSASEGQPNVYLREGGSVRFVATLAKGDISTGGGGSGFPSPVAWVPRDHIARTSADGLHLAFVSAGKLTGYDNTDASSGEADREVYVYDAESGKLVCASCNPSGAAPAGANLATENKALPTAAWIPGWQFQLYPRRPLSEDGNRLFFNSVDPLSLRDTNGAQDVYEWEAPGTGDCTSSNPSFSSQNEGCINLISSGKSPRDSEFVDASEDGSDVFLRTEESLSERDDGLIDIYDARVGGGEAPPEAAPPACEGDACQSVPAPPRFPDPGSSSFEGPANPTASRCASKGRRAAGLSRRARLLRRRAHRLRAPAKSRRVRRRAHRLARRAHGLSAGARRCRRAAR